MGCEHSLLQFGTCKTTLYLDSSEHTVHRKDPFHRTGVRQDGRNNRPIENDDVLLSGLTDPIFDIDDHPGGTARVWRRTAPST